MTQARVTFKAGVANCPPWPHKYLNKASRNQVNCLTSWGYQIEPITFKGHLPRIMIFSEWLIIMPLFPVIVREQDKLSFGTSSSSEQSDQIIHEEDISLLFSMASMAIIQEHPHH